MAEDPENQAAAAVAAVLSALHRRSGDEQITLHLTDESGEATAFTATLSAETTFGDLTAQAGTVAALVKAGSGIQADIGGDQLTMVAGPAGVLPAAGPATCFTAEVTAALAEGTRHPQRPVKALDPAGPPATADGGAPAEPVRCIHDFFADQATARPDAPAVTCGSTTLTYRELSARADRVAAVLRAHGVRSGATVGVLRPRGVELVADLLGILQAGAAYLALDTTDPPARWAELLNDSRAGFVLAETGLRERLPAGTVPVEVLADTPITPVFPSTARPQSPDSLAYVSYTSGSTGRAKGVAIPHRAVSRLLRDPGWAEFRSTDVFLELAPVMFDASTIELWAPLMNGGHLVVLPGPPTRLDEISRAVRRHGVTVLLLATGLFNQLATQDPDLFGQLRHLLIGGEAASAPHVREVLARHPGLLFTNGYGPTENTSFTTCWTTREAPCGDRVPIGGPIRGTSIAVLDHQLNPVRPGVAGELYTGGAGLARGYAGRPAATAGRFVASPLPGQPGQRLYRTGDLVRQRPDGLLEFVGRADRQIKIRGHRVEPGHVEAVLAEHPEVDLAVVVPQTGAAGHTRLLAYVTAGTTPAGQRAALGIRLRAHLRRLLADHLVPLAVHVRDELPLGPNGKIDHTALPHTQRAPRNVGTAFVPPSTPLQYRLAELWAEVLDVEPVGIEDDFFALGGHSLLAANLLAAIERELGRAVPAQVLYHNPTVTKLAEALSDGRTPKELSA
ncbi:amino acid adenylation domain-containing protein [Amycolatopsis magusensis]|uniref:amino acid adenylation domain-containing protein n=1 Tax=Amycolatopsis magusensis TaxID=882444 RepID=UPI003C2CB2E0